MTLIKRTSPEDAHKKKVSRYSLQDDLTHVVGNHWIVSIHPEFAVSHGGQATDLHEEDRVRRSASVEELNQLSANELQRLSIVSTYRLMFAKLNSCCSMRLSPFCMVGGPTRMNLMVFSLMQNR